MAPLGSRIADLDRYDAAPISSKLPYYDLFRSTMQDVKVSMLFFPLSVTFLLSREHALQGRLAHRREAQGPLPALSARRDRLLAA